MEIFKELFNAALMLIITCLINEGIRAYKDYTLAKKRGLEEDSKNYKVMNKERVFWSAKNFLDEIIRVAVLAAEQSKAGDVREMVKTGSVSRAYLLDIANDVFEAVKNQITYETRSILLTGINDLDTYIKNGIEKNVALVKEESLSYKNAIAYEDKVNELDYLFKNEASKELEKEYTGELLDEKEIVDTKSKGKE